MNWYLVDSNNIVQNCIVYDGVSNYTPIEGLILESSENVYNIGDAFIS